VIPRLERPQTPIRLIAILTINADDFSHDCVVVCGGKGRRYRRTSLATQKQNKVGGVVCQGVVARQTKGVAWATRRGRLPKKHFRVN
jgi:hypothetical protein